MILKNFDFDTRIDDSKKLTASGRERAYGEILDKAFVGIGIVDEKVIDEVNIYRASIIAMEKALSVLEMQPDYVIVDGRVKIPTKCPVKCIVRGDSISLSIAAASIVAKVTRDRLMLDYDKIYPEYGFARHKGYPTSFHKRALRLNGASPIHRKTFAPVASLIRC